jgi:hypothetical protein
LSFFDRLSRIFQNSISVLHGFSQKSLPVCDVFPTILYLFFTDFLHVFDGFIHGFKTGFLRGGFFFHRFVLRNIDGTVLRILDPLFTVFFSRI